MYALRLIIGVLLIAGAPELAKRAGPKLAGIVLLIPVISIAALYFTAHNLGSDVAMRVAKAGLIGLIPLAFFFLAVILTLKKMPPALALMTASLVWVATASAFIMITDSNV